MARNMNTQNQYLPMPTPPWKTNSPAVSNNFPIPPRNATNFEWKSPSNPSNQNDLRQNSGLGNAADFRPDRPSNYSDNLGGEFNRSNNYNPSSTIPEPSIGYGNQRANLSGGYNNDSFNSNINNGNNSINHDRSAPIDNDFDRGNYDNRGRNFDNRNDSYDRGNNYENRGNNFENRGNNFENRGNNFENRGNNFENQGNDFENRGNDFGNKGQIESSPLMSWKPPPNSNLRNSPIDKRSNSSLNSQNNSSNWRQERPRSPEKNDQDFNRRRNTRQSSNNNDNLRNQPPKPSVSQTKTPLKNPIQEVDMELEKKAMETDVSEDFFNKIKPLSLMQVAADVALRYARKEYYTNKGNNQKVPEKPLGSGQYTCKTCYVNFLTKEKLNTHNNGPQHKEMEDLYQVKKEQARLIMNKKIVGPRKPKLEMIQISKAEAENNLKPTEMELDVYILGVYESVMKPYWPLPKSQFYCRVCNYAEFNSESEMKRHNVTVDHKKREASYEEAFCLYCQQHYYDKASLDKHEATGQHIKIKDLMEKTKECAVEHWHKVNKIDVPDKFAPKTKQDEPETPKTGSKRTADADANKGLAKKPTKAEPTPKVTNTPKPSDSKKVEKPDTRTNDKKSSSTDKKNSKPDLKSDAKDKKEEPKKSDSKATSKSDSRSSVKTDSKSSKSNDPKSKSATKPESKADSKTESKTDSKTESKAELKDADKLWFAPIKGFMCVACHDFIADEAGQKAHLSAAKHAENVTKLKKLMEDEGLKLIENIVC